MKRTVKAFTAFLASTAIALAAAGSADARGGSGGGSGHSSPPLHGPGSSHNPIVYHPDHGPGSSHNPILATTTTVVRDHRHHSGPHGGGPNGSAPAPEGGVWVTQGRYRKVVPVQVGDFRIVAVQCNGLCNPTPPPAPIIHDHR